MMFNLHTHSRVPEPNAIVNCEAGEDVGAYRRISLGIHPWDVDENWRMRLDAMTRFVENSRDVESRLAAVGEIGLDKIRGGKMEDQRDCFMAQLRLAQKWEKPVIIHCVKAYHLVAECLTETRFQWPVVLHGFRGKPQLAGQLMHSGWFLSFGRRFNEESLKEAFYQKRMFLETDDEDVSIEEVYSAAARALSISPADIVVPGIFTS